MKTTLTIKVKYNEGFFKSLFSNKRELLTLSYADTLKHSFFMNNFEGDFISELDAKVTAVSFESSAKMLFPKAVITFDFKAA